MWRLIIALILSALALILLVKVFEAKPKVVPAEQIEEVKRKLAEPPKVWPEWNDGKG